LLSERGDTNRQGGGGTEKEEFGGWGATRKGFKNWSAEERVKGNKQGMGITKNQPPGKRAYKPGRGDFPPQPQNQKKGGAGGALVCQGRDPQNKA